jgi:hypothetical protein
VTQDAVLEVVETTFLENLGLLISRHHVDESIHVLEFDGSRDREIRTYATVGLARQVFQQDQEPIRQELLFDCYPRYASSVWTTLVAYFAGLTSLRGRPLARFECLRLDDGLQQLTGVHSLMCWIPLNHDEAVQFIAETRPPTVPVWLMAITGAEAAMAERDGWEGLMGAIEAKQPDVLDLKRRSIV